MLRNNKLEVFENFQEDRSLPKFNQNIQQVELGGSIPINLVEGQTFNGSSIFISSNGTSSQNWGTIGVPMQGWSDGSTEVEKAPKEPGWFGKLIAKFQKKKEEKRRTMTILSFFSSLARNMNDLKVLQDTANHYEAAIATAAKAGQTALVDRLKSRLASAKSEVQLVINGLTKYFTEEQIIDFYRKSSSDKNLKLTWIKHFVKPIPSKILDVKVDLDKQLVFDNYVILHYDPNNDATDITEEEKIRKKDPILFGVINGSRRLYYVADWIDEYCDLTLDVVVETLQERVNEVNNDKVKTYLDTGERKEERIKIPKPNHYASSAMTFQMPSYFEKVKDDLVEEVKKVKETFTKSVKEFMPRKKLGVKQTKKPMKRTSSAKELDKLSKKRKNGK